MYGYNYELVNILLFDNLSTIQTAINYKTTIDILNKAVSAHLGFSADIAQFITAEEDRDQLYGIFVSWKNKLLLCEGASESSNSGL